MGPSEETISSWVRDEISSAGGEGEQGVVRAK